MCHAMNPRRSTCWRESVVHRLAHVRKNDCIRQQALVAWAAAGTGRLDMLATVRDADLTEAFGQSSTSTLQPGGSSVAIDWMKADRRAGSLVPNQRR